MSIPKMHHYVPQGYLRFFVKPEQAGKRTRYSLLVYDKKNRKQYPANVSSIAAENDYNTLELSECLLLPPEKDSLYYEKNT